MDYRHCPIVVFFILATLACYSHGQGCRIADAAVRYNRISYIFVGPDYITLNDDNKEVSVDNKQDDWGGMGRVDAVLMWKDGNSWWNSWYPLIFEGASFSHYWLGTTSAYKAVVSGDGDDEWDPALNLDKGVDAGATVGQESYIFKCCHYVIFDHESRKVTGTGSLRDHGVPCDIHAAIEISDEELAVIKYDQVWVINLETANVTGPMDANEAMGLTAIKLCGEHEDAGISFVQDDDDDDDDNDDDDDDNDDDDNDDDNDDNDDDSKNNDENQDKKETK